MTQNIQTQSHITISAVIYRVLISYSFDKIDNKLIRLGFHLVKAEVKCIENSCCQDSFKFYIAETVHGSVHCTDVRSKGLNCVFITIIFYQNIRSIT